MSNEFRHKSVAVAGKLAESEWGSIYTHIFNNQATGDIPYASSTTQLSRWAIGATDTIASVQGGIPTWRTPANILTDLSGQAGAAFDWNSQNLTGLGTLSAFTLGGGITGGGYNIGPCGVFYVSSPGVFSSGTANSYVSIYGGTGAGSAAIKLYGQTEGTYPGRFVIQTPNDALAETNRLIINGDADTATATWSAVTHTDLNLSDYLGVFKTDTDSAVEGEFWYDNSENKLKFYNGAAVETVTSST